jgi:hypothetical protein
VFNYLLQKESWQESFLRLDLNISFNAFMDMILHHSNTVFPLKTVYMSKIRKNNGSLKEYKILVRG